MPHHGLISHSNKQTTRGGAFMIDVLPLLNGLRNEKYGLTLLVHWCSIHGNNRTEQIKGIFSSPSSQTLSLINNLLSA
jgi:hypothetical protein